MSRRSDILATNARLLDVKKARGLSASPPPTSEVECPDRGVTTCVNCGYSQQGQSFDRCPECGLMLASRLLDTTPWTAPFPGPIRWWETARRVWLWNRRLRMRTSYLPATPESWSFAKWSIAASAVLLGLALAAFNWNTQAPRPMAAGFFILHAAIATVLAGLLLLAGVYALTLFMQGTWRHRLRFVPSSIHYATAWWPLLSLLVLLFGAFSRALDPETKDALLTFLPLFVLATWALWLWASVTESEHVSHVASRIGVVALCMYAAAMSLLLIVPGSGRLLAASVFDRAGASLMKLNVLGTYASGPVSAGPRTYALLINNLHAGDESLIAEQVLKLGARNCVWIEGQHCTLEQIDKAFRTARVELRADDKFILFVRGHGAENGSGCIKMANGELTSQRLTELLQELPTTHCLAVLDSCFAGKFISAFRAGSCNVVVITSSDNRNVSFRSGLAEFWRALDKPESDSNGDGRVTVDEAFWSAFRTMLEQAEQKRLAALAAPMNPNAPWETQLLAEHGFETPQLNVLGKADGQDFSIKLPPPKPTRPPQP